MTGLGLGLSLGLSKGGGAEFSPTDIAGLDLWLDASDAATIDAPSGVSEWRDKSGNSNDLLQGTVGRRPSTGTRTQGGLNVIDFDNAQMAVASGQIINNGPATIIGVWQNDGDAPNQTILLSERSSAGLELNYTSTTNLGQMQFFYDTNGTNLTANTVTTGLSNPGVSVVSFDGGQLASGINFYAEGSAVSILSSTDSNVPLPNADGDFKLGRFSGSGKNFNGMVAELLIYNSVLSTSDRSKAESYLSSKWGI